MPSAGRQAHSTHPGASAWSTSRAAARRGSRSAEVRADTGARVRVSGGDGVTYYWPSGAAAGRRPDPDGGRRPSAGAGAAPPTAQRRTDERPRPLRALSGRRLPPGARPDPLPGERRRSDELRAPSPCSTAPSPTAGCRRCGFRSTAAWAPPAPSPSAARASSQAGAIFQMREIQFGPTSMPVCPIGPAIVSQPAGRRPARRPRG